MESKATNRPVYYHHIKMLLTPPDWHRLENPDDWWNLPTGSIIFFDEAHHLFPARSVQSKTPEIELHLNEHGHKGFDIYFVTQQPKFISPIVKGLCQEHWNVIRKFGTDSANIHKFLGVEENPQKKHIKPNAFEVEKYKYDKSVYQYYESSEQHNVKKNIPLKYKMLFVIPFIIFALVCKVVYGWFYSDNALVKEKTLKPLNTPQSQTTDLPSQSPTTYLIDYKPKIDDLPFTAPVYDGLRKPSIYPKPSLCIASKSQCKCYTQQNTKFNTSDSLCRDWALNGWFDDNPSNNDAQSMNMQTADIKPIEPLNLE